MGMNLTGEAALRGDRFGAFCTHDTAEMAATGPGPLDGTAFAVKDLFDIAGHITGCGNPDWFASHAPATATAPAVTRCLDAGARLVGKTKTVEMAFSLTGENPHYGTPENPAAPGRLPGGSSCGSAAAVAGGLCDFALGTDTGGSVRIPASYCGLFGIRPTHGRVDIAGVVPLAASFDTVGWFARDPGLLQSVGAVLLDGAPAVLEPGRLLCPAEAWASADDTVDAALRPALAALRDIAGEPVFEPVSDQGLGEWYGLFRPIQAFEAWHSHGAWIEAQDPTFGPGVRERFQFCKTVSAATVSAARAARQAVAERLRGLLGDDAVMALPTAPVPAPPSDSSQAAREAVRDRTLAVTSIAGLGGLPEVSLPVARVGGVPVGLSLLGAPGTDEALLDLAVAVADVCGHARMEVAGCA